MTPTRKQLLEILSSQLGRELPPDVVGVVHTACRMAGAVEALPSGVTERLNGLRTWSDLLAVLEQLEADA
jgi:hypothetical protein